MESIKALKVFLVKQRADNGGHVSSKDLETPEGIDKQISEIPKDAQAGVIMYLNRKKQKAPGDYEVDKLHKISPQTVGFAITIESMFLDMREGIPRVISKTRYKELRKPS